MSLWAIGRRGLLALARDMVKVWGIVWESSPVSMTLRAFSDPERNKVHKMAARNELQIQGV